MPVAGLGTTIRFLRLSKASKTLAEALWWADECPPKIHVHLEPQTMALFGNWVFIDVISQDKFTVD